MLDYSVSRFLAPKQSRLNVKIDGGTEMKDRISFWEKVGPWFYEWCYPLALFLAIFLGLLSIATGYYIFGLSSPLSRDGTSIPFGLIIGPVSFLVGILLLIVVRRTLYNVTMVVGTLTTLVIMIAVTFLMNFLLAPLF